MVALRYGLHANLALPARVVEAHRGELHVDGATSRHRGLGRARAIGAADALTGRYAATIIHEDERGTIQIYTAIVARCLPRFGAVYDFAFDR